MLYSRGRLWTGGPEEGSYIICEIQKIGLISTVWELVENINILFIVMNV